MKKLLALLLLSPLVASEEESIYTFTCVAVNSGLVNGTNYVLVIDKEKKQIRNNHIIFDLDFSIDETEATARREYTTEYSEGIQKQSYKFNKFTGLARLYRDDKIIVSYNCKKAKSLID